MRAWALMLGGLLVWTVHFFLLYGFASIFPGREIAYWLTIAATVPAIAADAGLLLLTARLRRRGNGDELRSWMIDIAAGGAALSLLALLWQVLPAFIA